MIVLRSSEEIKKLRASNQIVAAVMGEIKKSIHPGTTTLELDEMAEKLVIEMGGTPAFKGYKGFKHTLCTSVNEQVVHGIPNKRKLQEGDILSIDIGVKLDGYFGDHAVTVPVGKVSEDAKRLLKFCEEALWKGIGRAKAGNRLFDVSNAIQVHAEAAGFYVVKV